MLVIIEFPNVRLTFHQNSSEIFGESHENTNWDFIIKSLEMFEFGVLKGLHFRMRFLIMDYNALWQYELASFHDRDTKLET